MGIVDSKTFKSGNSVALRLPKELGVGPNVAMKIEQNGTTFTVRRAVDPVEERRKFLEMIEALRALGPVGDVEIRDPDIFPDRPGLYS